MFLQDHESEADGVAGWLWPWVATEERMPTRQRNTYHPIALAVAVFFVVIL